MSEQEFKDFVEEQKASGKSEEDIVKVFCLMFRDGELDRTQLEAVITAMGYEMSDELKGMSDEELKEKIVSKEGEDEDVSHEDKVDPDGDVPPSADPEEKPKEEAKETEEVSEEKAESEDGKSETEEEERERVMKLYGLGNK